MNDYKCDGSVHQFMCLSTKNLEGGQDRPRHHTCALDRKMCMHTMKSIYSQLSLSHLPRMGCRDYLNMNSKCGPFQWHNVVIVPVKTITVMLMEGEKLSTNVLHGQSGEEQKVQCTYAASNH